MLKVMKKWYSIIYKLRQKYNLVVKMRDNPGENKSHEAISILLSLKG
jgi:hypothetical protein